MLKKTLLAISAGLTILSAPLALAALELPSAPPGGQYVADYANILTDQTESELNNQLAEFEKETSTEIAVATVDTLQGYSIAEYGIELARNWGVGQKDIDNGILLIIASTEREIRIEVGYGLEGALPDSKVSRIINQIMVPSLKYDDYDTGIKNGVLAIQDAVRGEEFIAKDPTEIEPWWDVLIILVPFFWLILSWFSGSKGWWAGGIFGAIFGFLVYALDGLLFGLIIGLLLDFVLSKFFFGKIKASDGPSFWDFIGGGGRGGFGGGGGGFGGGGFGGGGASGRF